MDYDPAMIKNSLSHDHPSRRALLLGVASLSFMPLSAHAADPLVVHVTSPRILGKADAPIKVIELFSMTCSHCASFHNNTFPDVKKRLIDTGMVHFEMQPFPLDQVALRAHALARALPRKTNISQWYLCYSRILTAGPVTQILWQRCYKWHGLPG